MATCLLMGVARRMKAALREADSLARIGGDEFIAVLLDLPDVDAARPVLEKLLAAVSQPDEQDEAEIPRRAMACGAGCADFFVSLLSHATRNINPAPRKIIFKRFTQHSMSTRTFPHHTCWTGLVR